MIKTRWIIRLGLNKTNGNQNQMLLGTRPPGHTSPHTTTSPPSKCVWREGEGESYCWKLESDGAKNERKPLYLDDQRIIEVAQYFFWRHQYSCWSARLGLDSEVEVEANALALPIADITVEKREGKDLMAWPAAAVQIRRRHFLGLWTEKKICIKAFANSNR